MSAPDIGARERALVAEVLESPTLSGGPMVARFEAGVASRAGRRHAVAASSGTAGLHMSVSALGIGPGHAVVTSSYSFVASVNCFLYEGARPLLADIERETYGLDPASVEDALARSDGSTRAVLPVHVFGQPCDMTALSKVAGRRGLPILEDACEALGGEHAGRPAGSFGDMAVFAFYPNKQMTTGEGGIVVTDDDELAARCRSLRNQGRGSGTDWFTHVVLGYNYRLDELSAALGVAQIDRLDELLAQRARVAERYNTLLVDVDGLDLPRISHLTTRMSWFVYVVTLDPALDRDRLILDLDARGVPTRSYFRPIHLQPYYIERFGDQRGSLPVTEDIGSRTIALPFHGQLSEESIGFVREALIECIGMQA